MNTQIIEMAGLIVVCGACFIATKIEISKNKALERKNKRLESENHDLWTKGLRDKAEIKELHKTILFDNDVAIQRTEKLDQANDRFAKDQITIADLNHELCEANYKVVELESEIDSMEHRGWRKIMRARLLGGVENV